MSVGFSQTEPCKSLTNKQFKVIFVEKLGKYTHFEHLKKS